MGRLWNKNKGAVLRVHSLQVRVVLLIVYVVVMIFWQWLYCIFTTYVVQYCSSTSTRVLLYRSVDVTHHTLLYCTPPKNIDFPNMFFGVY
jgi:hypothetical protein